MTHIVPPPHPRSEGKGSFTAILPHISPNLLNVDWERTHYADGLSGACWVKITNEDGAEVSLGDDPDDYSTQLCDIAHDLDRMSPEDQFKHCETSWELENA